MTVILPVQCKVKLFFLIHQFNIVVDNLTLVHLFVCSDVINAVECCGEEECLNIAFLVSPESKHQMTGNIPLQMVLHYAHYADPS